MLYPKYTVEKENIHPFDIYESNGNGEKNKIRVDEPSIFNRLVVGLFPQNIGMYMSTLLLLATAFYSYGKKWNDCTFLCKLAVPSIGYLYGYFYAVKWMQLVCHAVRGYF